MYCTNAKHGVVCRGLTCTAYPTRSLKTLLHERKSPQRITLLDYPQASILPLEQKQAQLAAVTESHTLERNACYFQRQNAQTRG